MNAPARAELAGPVARDTQTLAGPLLPLTKVLGCLKLAGRLARTTTHPDPQEDLRQKANRYLEISRAACDLHGLDVQVRGALPQGAAVMVCNHLGFIDPLILGTLRPCAPIAKAEVDGWPVVGSAADRMGALFVQRENPHSGATVIRRAYRALEAGVSILNFPERTTTDGSQLGPFKRGVFGLSQMLGVPVVPMYLTMSKDLLWVGDDYFLPHYIRFARRHRTEVQVRIGAPIRPSLAPTAEALAELTRTRMQALATG